jgi:hypothetical protein
MLLPAIQLTPPVGSALPQGFAGLAPRPAIAPYQTGAHGAGGGGGAG